MLLKVCLNGGRAVRDHPSIPVTPARLSDEARRSVEAGAGAVHLHPRDESGAETLAAAEVGAAVRAVREACGAPTGVSTGAWIEADPERRVALIRGWAELLPGERPDFASVNLFEEGWEAVCGALFDAGIGVEAGLWSADDARRFVAADLAGRCLRVLLEPVRESSAADALAAAREMDRILDGAGVDTPRLLHGKDATAWPVLRRAAAEGYGQRIGFEDTLTLPHGEPAHDNAQLVSAATGGAAPR